MTDELIPIEMNEYVNLHTWLATHDQIEHVQIRERAHINFEIRTVVPYLRDATIRFASYIPIEKPSWHEGKIQFWNVPQHLTEEAAKIGLILNMWQMVVKDKNVSNYYTLKHGRGADFFKPQK